MKENYFLLMVLLFLPSYTLGADFYLAINNCKTVVGVPEESDEGIQVYNSTRYIASCTRTGEKVTCDVVFEDNSKSTKVIYRVVMETPPLFSTWKQKTGQNMWQFTRLTVRLLP